jgi:hypothetical protein
MQKLKNFWQSYKSAMKSLMQQQSLTGDMGVLVGNPGIVNNDARVQRARG